MQQLVTKSITGITEKGPILTILNVPASVEKWLMQKERRSA